MPSIEQIIADKRRTTTTAKRKTFSLARQHGIRKLREFALADPHYYILELIQAAIANEATAVSFYCDKKSFGAKFVGGGFSRNELAHIFDFLFASKDNLQVGHLRELALGINALMFFEPDEVVIESGSGRDQAATRITLRSNRDEVEVAELEYTRNGTLIIASGMHRGRASKRSPYKWNPLLPPERQVVDERCLCAPVPILINDEAPFGFGSVRIPSLWNFEHSLSFDEDEMYGAVGVRFSKQPALFRLLTYGVWLQSVEKKLLPNRNLGGVINFDRLRKTADHSAVVQDHVLEELWLRVKPYAQQLILGESTPTLHSARTIDGTQIAPGDLRAFLRETGLLAAVAEEDLAEPARLRRAEEIGRALHIPVLVIPGEEIPSLRQIGGRKVRIVEPELNSDDEVSFFRRPPDGGPPEPWLASPVEIQALEIERLVELLCDERDKRGKLRTSSNSTAARKELLALLGGRGEVTGMLYAPDSLSAGQHSTRTQLLVADRVAWEGDLPSAFTGQWLVIKIPDVAPLRMLESREDLVFGNSVGEAVARTLLKSSANVQSAMELRTLDSMHRYRDSLTDGAKRIALQALVRMSLVRLRRSSTEDPEPRLAVSSLARNDSLLDLPIFETLKGVSLSPRELIESVHRTHGLVYGTLPEIRADLNGLDPTDVLKLDEESERLLSAWLGSATYVRIDRRDVLAEHRGVLCRDMALGLRRFPEFPLMTEGVDPTEFSEEERSGSLSKLVDQLIACFLGLSPEPPKEQTAFATWEEDRREACRHLQYFVCREMRRGKDAQFCGAEDLPLFLDLQGNGHSPSAVASAMRRENGIILHGRGKLGNEELGRLTDAAIRGLLASEVDPPSELVVSPFVAKLLAPLGRIRLPFDFDLTNVETASNPATQKTAFVAKRTISGTGFGGRIGIPTVQLKHSTVVLLAADGHPLDAISGGELAGYIIMHSHNRGTDPLLSAEEREEIITAIAMNVDPLMGDLAEALPHGADRNADRARLEKILLDYASAHLHLAASPLGVVVPSVTRPAAQRILEMPLFALSDDFVVSGWQLTAEFCAHGTAAFDNPSLGTALYREKNRERNERLPAHLATWIETNLCEARVLRPASGQPPPPLPPSQEEDQESRLSTALTHFLENLRPDDHLGNDRKSGSVTLARIQHAIDSVDPRRPWLVTRNEVATYFERRPDESKGANRGSWLHLNRDHPLVQQALEQNDTGEPTAWLLLACYAQINERLEPVTNEHEQLFQRRVLAELERGGFR